MTKNFSDSDFDGDASTSSSSISSNAVDESLIGSTIIAEEERLLIENEKAEMEEVAKFANNDVLSKEMNEHVMSDEELARQLEAEIREKRYKRLMHLLNNSKMYSMILKDKIQEEEENERKRSESVTSKKSKETSKNKSKSKSNYELREILTEKKIEEKSSIDGEKNSGLEAGDEDYFKETRVTSLGFTVSYKQPLLLEGGMMRDYQLKGLEWMKILFMNGVNGILADEMGLGKTIQVISFICYMIEQDIKGPFLIVTPLSTISNWVAEFKRFAPNVPTMVYHGPEAERRALIPKILEISKCLDKNVHNVIITSYQVPLRDKSILEKINWYYLIIDEGHRIKNHNSNLSRTLRQFNTIGRLLLTGTPLQNDLSELWSLLNFLLPEVFYNLDVFESWFDIKELEKNGTRFAQEKFNIDVVTILQEILMPFLLRREKKDINLKLPPKKEVLIYCPMTSQQKELYQATVDRTIENLLKPKDEGIDVTEPLPKRRCFLNSRYGNVLDKSNANNYPKKESPKKQEERFSINFVLRNPQMQLRKIVNHPYLIRFPLKTGTEELRIDEDMVTSSGKLLVLDALLAKLKDRGHKVVVFSCFKVILDILENHAIMRGYKYCRLDGDLNISDRDEEILNFVSDPDIFVFYITVRAGGLGINLTAADTVIFFDSDWNPQVNLQSQDRCHRIGQTKPVVVYKLCTKGTIDEQIIERGNAKRRLEKMILQKGKYTLNVKNPKNLNLMDLQELRKLLSSTDHDTVINSNGFVLSDEELEAILDRSEMSNQSQVFKTLIDKVC